MVSDTVKIRVRSGTSEAEIEADLTHIREAIDLIPEVVKKLPDGSTTSHSVPSTVSETPSDVASAMRPAHTELPNVRVEKSDSLSDVIEKFFGDSWGRDRRKLSDVRETLQSYGLNYPKQSVAVALLRLAKTTKLRRYKAEDGEYVYTATSTLLSPLGPPQAYPSLDSEAEPKSLSA